MPPVNPHNDHSTSIEELKTLLREFRDARNWKKFHTPKNLAEAISIEAAELMEHVLWKSDEEIKDILQDPAHKNEIKDELADILCYCLNLANVLEIDVSTALREKIEKNSQKYPVEKSRDSAKKYTQL